MLIEEMDVNALSGVSSKVYRCDFSHSRLEDTKYELTEDKREFAQIDIQCIRDGKLYYIGISDSEKSQGNAKLLAMDKQGRKEMLDEVLLEYPYLNAQFFLSEDRFFVDGLCRGSLCKRGGNGPLS